MAKDTPIKALPHTKSTPRGQDRVLSGTRPPNLLWYG